MTYGLKVYNTDGREVINSDESFKNLKLTTGTVSAPIANNTSSFSPGTSLIFARPNSTSSTCGLSVTRYYSFPGSSVDTNERYMADSTNFAYSGPGTYNIATTAIHTAPATRSEYGLEVFDSNTNTIFVTQDFNNSFDILYSGYSNTQTISFTGLDNWTTSAGSDIYVMLNSCYHTYFAGAGFPAAGEYETFIGYEFNTNGSITFRQEVHVRPQSGTDSIQALPQLSGNAYLVVRVR